MGHGFDLHLMLTKNRHSITTPGVHSITATAQRMYKSRLSRFHIAHTRMVRIAVTNEVLGKSSVHVIAIIISVSLELLLTL